MLKLAILRDASSVPQKARQEIEHLEQIAKRLDADLDFLVWELRPTALDDLGLREALSDYADTWSQHFDIKVDVDLEALASSPVEHDVETVLYRTSQEALNNIAKHAAATEVKIALARDGNELVLSIADNGQGFDPKKAMTRAAGLGLVGMRERASLVGGSFDIESQPGRGATVRIRVPVTRA